MHAKFQVAGFQNKRYIRNRSLDFVCLFLLGHIPVQVTIAIGDSGDLLLWVGIRLRSACVALSVVR